MVSDTVHDYSNIVIDVREIDPQGKGIRDGTFGYRSEVDPIDTDKQLIVAIDPSKTNTAVIVGGLSGNIYSIFEISGAGSHIPNHVFCELLRRYLQQKLSGKNVVLFAQEQVVFAGGKTGSHRSMVYLNEIRANLNELARNDLNINPLEVNNAKWKAHILPSGYRKKSMRPKGSWQWLTSKFPSWHWLSDDVTDALCIFLYIKDMHVDSIPIFCVVPEKSDGYEAHIIPESGIPEVMLKQFKINPQFSIEENSHYFANRSSQIGIAHIPPEMVTPATLYGCTCHLTVHDSPEHLHLLVRRQ